MRTVSLTLRSVSPGAPSPSSLSRPRRTVVALLAPLLAIALAAGACGDDDGTANSTTTTEPPVAGTDAPTSNDTTSTTEAAPGPVIEVSYAGGEIVGGGRHGVSVGDIVTLRVTTDVADEIHLHGYDLSVDAPAGVATDLVFEASIPGVFEAELESLGLHLVELEIS